MSLISKVHNKFVYLGITGILMSLLFTIPTGMSAQEQTDYSGKEIFGAVALGQGELAKEFPEIWSDEMYETANNEENSQKAEAILDKIAEDNPEYLNELEKSVKDKNYVKVNQLLENGGDILNESMNVEDSKDIELIDGVGNGNCAIFVAVYVAGAAYHDVLAWTREYVWTSDDPIMRGDSNFQQKEIVKNLIESVN